MSKITAITLLVVMMFALCACHSRKVSTTRDALKAEANITVEKGGISENTSWSWRRLLAMCDSLNLTFHADSVKTPGGIFYNPTLGVDMASPSVSEEETHATTAADSIADNMTATIQEDSTTDSTEEEDKVSVAEPPGLSPWLRYGLTALMVIPLLALIIRIYRKYHQGDK